jgi:transposase
MNSERFINSVLTPMLSKFEDLEKGFIFFSKIFIFFFLFVERDIPMPEIEEQSEFPVPDCPPSPPIFSTFSPDYNSLFHPPFEKVISPPDLPVPQQILLHFDNAPAHTSKMTKSFLKKSNISTLHAPPYSPDLAPSDFFLFGYLKQELKGSIFHDSKSLKDAIEHILRNIPQDLLYRTFENWRKRCEQVQTDGEYYTTTH